MRAVLVNPPHTEFDRSEIAPPLGLLRIGSTAQRMGWEVEIIDFNLMWHSNDRLRTNFYDVATDSLLERMADVYGFTSMCADTHVALELASRLKAKQPNAVVVVGGTHFSSLADAVRRHFRWIDHVICGEGEVAFQQFLSQYSNKTLPPNPELAPIDYSLVDFTTYRDTNPYAVADVESSRGCRFKCQFCYSPAHYPARRVLDTERLLAELDFLKRAGARHLFFVDDNFLNDEARAVSVCSALREAQLGLTWHCYATAPQITPRAIEAMSRAGCTAIFTGVDAIGPTSERRYGKRFSSGIDDRIRLCLDHGITPTCAFLVAPPSHACGADGEQTVRTALAARALGAHVRLNVLTYYSRTRLLHLEAPRLEPDANRIALELDVPGVVVRNRFAASAPEMFPFHARYVAAGEWIRFVQQMHVLFTLLYARCDELAEIVQTTSCNLFDLSDRVLGRTGNLLALPKLNRRRIEVDAFDAVVGTSPLAELVL